MPDLNHRLQSGRMNKDLDERLVPNGEYRDAMNAQVGTSDGSDVGSLQNILGNIDLSSTVISPGGNLSNFYCVGSIKDSKTDRLYWLLSGDGIDIIAEYDYNTEVVSPIVVDIFPINVSPMGDNDRVLNFDKSFLITGINIIEDILLWTDNNSEPKKINIPQVRIGSVDFFTHTEFYVPNPDDTSSTPYVSVGPIIQEHITVIKKGPKTAPRLEMKNTNRADLNADGTPGDIETTLTSPDLSAFFDQNTGQYITTPISVTFDTVPDFKLNDQLVIEAISSGASQKQEMVVDIVGGGGFDVNGNAITVPFGSGWNGTCDISIQSWDLNIDLSQDSWNVKLKQDDPLFEFKFPRFGYRYKYSDGEYSTFSPFSEVAFLPGDFDYIPKEGYNLGMVNNVRSLGVCDFVDLRSIPDDVVSIDILYKESNSPVVYSVKTIKRVSIDPGGNYDEWNAINSSTLTTGVINNTTGYLNIKSELIHAAIPANQLLRGWDNVPRKALAQEIVGNRVVYGNYLQNYSLTNARAQKPTALRYADNNSQVTLPSSKNIIVDAKLVAKSRDIGKLIPEQLDAGIVYNYNSAKTIKSLRTYQLGVVYIDEFGRETPVFSSSKINQNTVQIEKKSAPLQTKLKAQIHSAKPDWAKHFKFLIKETSNEYYNLAMDRWYLAEDGNIWLSFPSSERNKVQAGDFLTLKKAHDSIVAVTDPAKYKILDIDNEAPLFLKTKRQPKGQLDDNGTFIDPTVPLGSGLGFPNPQGTFITVDKPAIETIVERIFDEGTADYEFRLVSVDGASGWYGIKNITEDPTGFYKITSKKAFGVDMSITSTPSGTGYGNCTIEFVKKEIVNKPEFDGRFFAKILKDATLQEYIIGYQLGAQKQYVVSNAIQSQYINPDHTYSGFTAGSDWYGYDPDKISLADANDNSGINVGGAGDSYYWDRAGNTPFTGSSSSGWFIDKVEGFRAFKYTKHFYNKDNSSVTNPKTAGNAFQIVYPGHSDPDPMKQLQVIGTNTSLAGGNNSYLGIPSCRKPGDTLRNAPVSDYGHITPSEGINPTTGIIHLSYAGTGDNVGGGPLSGLGNLKSWFGDWSSTQSYVDEIAFLDAITTPGTIWRWKEDPGSVVYKTKSNNPAVTDYTTPEWNANQRDVRDGELGTELWNYTKLSDYGVGWNFKFGHMSWPAGNWVQDGSIPITAFVSQSGVSDIYQNYGTLVPPVVGPTGLVGGQPAALATYGLATASLGAFEYYHINEAENNHPPRVDQYGFNYRWPMFTEDWSQARSRRRRFTIHADTHEVDASGNGYGLGGTWLSATGQGYGYLPTNDPSTSAYFNENGALLTTLPLSDPPGIRPDGMYSGFDNPSGNYTFNGSTTNDKIPSLKMTDGTDTTPAPGSVTWQILDSYIEDGNDEGYFSTNPAIWETEPKEDIGLDIYHEVGQIYPTELNASTIGQFFGPIHANLARNSQVTCWMPGTGGGMIDLETDAGGKDIRLFNVIDGTQYGGSSDEVFVIMYDINGNPLDVNNAVELPIEGSRLMFTRADGSRTEVSVKTVPVSGGFGGTIFEVETDAHNYEVVLPWFNAYSFGNGVESNRIRDDYNQVVIDKGPKVSTILEEPYSEEHRSSGLIYSGIYNSMSGVNNLNQFIQAEKITKDLNPSYGSIQKLFTRNTNLVTLCEDKVFKILANKDALFNADGNINLTASENVLGQTIPFSGDYGISTNPESFASDAYRLYFADRARGSILRLSQDGLTPISSIGMTDWFADNLSASNRIVGTFDGKKNEYNVSLSYYNYSSLFGKIIGNSKTGYPPYSPTKFISVTASVALQISKDDDIIGVGFPAGTFVVDKVNQGGGVWLIQTNQPPQPADVAPLGNAISLTPYPSNDAGWSTIFSSSAPSIDPLTLSFSEINKGWVSFKSFHFEDGLSLNNDYFTFKGGQLFKHHANPKHNTFYEDLCYPDKNDPDWKIKLKICRDEAFTESSVEVLFNELPGSVKSFQTLNYEGSQSKITADVDNSGEYWDNNDKLGWYVDNMHTNLQEGDRHEFKDKEGKWFSQIKGVATEWLDDGTAGNIDTNEFSYQGIDEAGALDGGDQYTSWDCLPVSGTITCAQGAGIIIVDNVPKLINGTIDITSTASWMQPIVDWAIDNFPSAPLANYSFMINTNAGTTIYMSLTSVSGSAGTSYSGQEVLDNLDAAGISNVTTPIQSGLIYYYVGSASYNICDPGTIASGQHSCTEVQGLVGTVDGGPYATVSACEADVNAPCYSGCVVPNIVVPHVSDATQGGGCTDGEAAVEVTLMHTGATEWTVEYVDSNTNTVVYTDPTTYNFSPGWSDPAPLAVGSYAARVTDNSACPPVEVPFPLECLTIPCPPNPHVINPTIKNPTYDAATTSCLLDGGIELEVISLGNGASYIDQIELFSVVGGTSTSIQVDMTDYFVGDTISFNNLAEGDYEYTITDDVFCPYTESFTIECFGLPTGDCSNSPNVMPAWLGSGMWGYTSSTWGWSNANFDVSISFNPVNVISGHFCGGWLLPQGIPNNILDNNAAVTITINSLAAGASSFAYSISPGSPASYTWAGQGIVFGAAMGSVGVGVDNTWGNTTDPDSREGQWIFAIEDDLGNTWCRYFTINCRDLNS